MLQGESGRVVELPLPPQIGKPSEEGVGETWLREGNSPSLLPSPPEPLLAHLFEIYGKIFGLSLWAGGHRCVAWDSGVEELRR